MQAIALLGEEGEERARWKKKTTSIKSEGEEGRQGIRLYSFLQSKKKKKIEKEKEKEKKPKRRHNIHGCFGNDVFFFPPPLPPTSPTSLSFLT